MPKKPRQTVSKLGVSDVKHVASGKWISFDEFSVGRISWYSTTILFLLELHCKRRNTTNLNDIYVMYSWEALTDYPFFFVAVFGKKIIMAVKQGGSPDPKANKLLGDLIKQAKANSVPVDVRARSFVSLIVV